MVVGKFILCLCLLSNIYIHYIIIYSLSQNLARDDNPKTKGWGGLKIGTCRPLAFDTNDLCKLHNRHLGQLTTMHTNILILTLHILRLGVNFSTQ